MTRKRQIPSGAWDSSELLAGAARAVQADDALRALQRWIEMAPMPDDINRALAELTQEAWMGQVTHTRRTDRRARLARRASLALMVLLAACLITTLVGYFAYRRSREFWEQLFLGTYTLTPTITPTVTRTSTPTPTSTATPSSTPSPTPTPTLPPSTYAVTDWTGLYPPVPLGAEAVWVLDDAGASLAPSNAESAWMTAISADPHGRAEPYRYLTAGAAVVTWTMDVAFEPGMYQVYVLDTMEHSFGPAQVAVQLDEIPAVPTRGWARAVFGQQTVDSWLPLGAYRLTARQTLGVQLAVDLVTPDRPFAADRVLVVRIAGWQQAMLAALPAGRPLAVLLDDAPAVFSEVVNGRPVRVTNQGQPADTPQSWNGRYRYRPEPWEVPVQVDWPPIGRLPAGRYELQVRVPPENANVPVDFALVADGELVARPTPARINQAEHAGQWVSLGIWQLEAEAAVSVRMTAPVSTGRVGVDAVALLRIEE